MYTIAAAPTVRNPRGHMLMGYPAIDVWWSRDANRADETVIVRQEYDERITADVLELTLAQAYDLIEALTKAIEST